MPYRDVGTAEVSRSRLDRPERSIRPGTFGPDRLIVVPVVPAAVAIVLLAAVVGAAVWLLRARRIARIEEPAGRPAGSTSRGPVRARH
jgi:hypothetical protein